MKVISGSKISTKIAGAASRSSQREKFVAVFNFFCIDATISISILLSSKIGFVCDVCVCVCGGDNPGQ